MESKKLTLLYIIVGFVITLFYMQKPLFHTQGEDFMAYKQYDENYYIARITQVANGNSKCGYCPPTHEMDDKKPIYPAYAENFVAWFMKTFDLSIRSTLRIIYFICPVLIFTALYFFIQAFNLHVLLYSIPVLASAMLATEVRSLKPLFRVLDFGYILPFERFFNPLIITFPLMFFMAFLARMYHGKTDKWTIILAGFWGGVTYYTQGYYYTIISICLIIFTALTFFKEEDRKIWKSIFGTGLLVMLVGSPVIYTVLFGEKIPFHKEQLWTVGLMLPFGHSAYLTHKGMVLSLIFSFFVMVKVPAHRKAATFSFILQFLVYLMSGLPFFMNKILLIHHVKTFNIFTYLLNYLILSQILDERIGRLDLYNKVKKYIPIAMVLGMFVIVTWRVTNDYKLHFAQKDYIEKYDSMVKLIDKKYKGKLFLADFKPVDYILSNTDAQVYSSRFMNFCSLHPESLLKRNLLPLVVYNENPPILNKDCSYYWPYIGFVIEEFEKINTNCRAYNDYIIDKIKNISVSEYMNNDPRIEYVLKDKSKYFNQEFLSLIYDLEVVEENAQWMIYKATAKQGN